MQDSETQEKKPDIEVLDPGVDPGRAIEPDWECCWGAFLSLRG